VVKAKSPIFTELKKGFNNLDIRTRKNDVIELGAKRIPYNQHQRSEKTIIKKLNP